MDTLQFFNLTFEKESTVEIFLRNCSFFTLFISMMFYWIQTAFSSTITYGNYKSQTNFNQAPPLAPISPSVRTAGFLAIPKGQTEGGNKSFGKQTPPFRTDGGGGGAMKKNSLAPLKVFFQTQTHNVGLEKGGYNFGTITMIISNFLLMFLLIVRWRESGHFPLSNLYESLMFLSWSCTFIHLILELKTEIVRPDATLFMRSIIGSITSPSALFTNAFATFSLPPEMQKASPLVPALQSNWLMMHVTVMIISYSALILGSLLSIAFLILISDYTPPALMSPSVRTAGFLAIPKGHTEGGNKSFGKQTSLLRSEGSSPVPTIEKGLLLIGDIKSESEGADVVKKKKINSGFASQTEDARTNPQREQHPVFFSGAAIPPYGHPVRSKGGGNMGQAKAKNNLAWNFDNLSYRVLGIGFPFLTIGILSGAVRANEAWGSYWSWDPKETWALLTWLIFAIYLHARITKGWQGKKPAIIASFGFFAIWVCFLGVNLIGEGLHSYGWFSLS